MQPLDLELPKPRKHSFFTSSPICDGQLQQQKNDEQVHPILSLKQGTRS